MNKTTKGALAAVAAGVLLSGGAGSLAYWHAQQDVGSASIDSGHVTLSAPDCTTAPNHGWQLDNGDVYTPGTTVLVPGDSISKICTMTLDLVGDHIGADLSIDTAALTADGTTLAAELAPSATFTVDGGAYAPITNPGSHTIKAVVSVAFNGPAATNGSMDGAVNLDAINVTADQTHTP